jgi:voltage-gated potassium channel
MSEEALPAAGADGRPALDTPAEERHGELPAPPAARMPRHRSVGIRRAPKPRMHGLLDSPVRNFYFGVAYTITVMVLATAAHMAAGWSFRDAIYMVIVTIYTVGYNEVRPIDTPALNVITIALIVFGCTGIIFLTGVLVRFITLSQFNKVMGQKRMMKQIDQLGEHVIVCGFGRIGIVLARALSASSAGFVIVEQNEARAAEARAHGCLCIHGDAADEAILHAAGVTRARVLATVLPNDAVNVFITLSARSLNPNLSIIARGELPSTEGELMQAGASKVVLPTHIGAERIAELILFEESSRIIDSLERTHGFQRALRTFDIELEVVTAAPQCPAIRMTVAAIERQARGTFFIVQINRATAMSLRTRRRPQSSKKVTASS